MKNKRRFKGLAICSIVLGLSACAAPPTKPPVNPDPIVNAQISVPTIMLQVVQGQLEVVNSPTPGCGSGNGTKGCILTGLANISVARVELRGSGGYELTRFWVCDGLNKPAGGVDGCVLASAGQEEFLVIAEQVVDNPDGKGLVVLGGVDEFFLVNQNSFQADYFYLVEACRAGAACTILDPRIRNGGRRITS
jgi:hypothetical protein